MSDTPKNILQRNEYGLIKGINYIFDEKNLIDWRKMVPIEYLVPNKDKTDETDVTKLTEDKLIILLGGLKYLAQLRGFLSVSYNVVNASDQYASVTCKIKWKPNYETENETIEFEAVAGAHLNNVRSFARYYLIEIAENRAFARCVRNFLRINIVSDKELGEEGQGSAEETNTVTDERKDVIKKLENFMKKRNLIFEDIKKRLLEEGNLEATNYVNIQSVPTSQIIDILTRMKKKEKNNPVPE